MNKSIHVIRREYIAHVRRRSFIVSTILVPVFMLLFFLLPLALTWFVPDDQYNVTVYDETGVIGEAFRDALKDTLDNGEPRFVVGAFTPAPGEEKRMHDTFVNGLQSGGIDILVEIPRDVLESGKVKYLTRDVRSFQIQDTFKNRLDEIVLRLRLQNENIDYAKVAQLSRGVTLEMSQITNKGNVEQRDFLSEWGTVFLFVMILYMALLTWGITISRGIIEEKGSRVIEVLLSSLRPVDLLFGKVVGIGAAGLTQLLIWGIVGATLTAFGASSTAPLLEKVHIPPAAFVYMVVYFVLGFLLYSSIFTVIGSICSTEQDAQQLQGIVTMPLIVPILCLMLIIQSPNGLFSVILSLIPLFSPMVMLARIVLYEPPWWQVALSMALLGVSIYGSVVFSARVFRIGILMYGKRPALREVVRWYRQAASG